jgi:hypothetical protein
MIYALGLINLIVPGKPRDKALPDHYRIYMS